MHGKFTNPFYYSDGLKNNHIIPLGRLRFLSLSLSLSLHLIFFEFPLPGRGEKRTCRAQSFQVDKRRNLQSVRRISALPTIPTGYSGTIGWYFQICCITVGNAPDIQRTNCRFCPASTACFYWPRRSDEKIDYFDWTIGWSRDCQTSNVEKEYSHVIARHPMKNKKVQSRDICERLPPLLLL